MAYPTSSSRTGYVGTVSPGDVLTAANFSKLPGGLVSYAQITSSGSGLTGFTAISGLSVSCPGTASRMYKITIGAAGFALGGTGTVTADFVVYDATASAALSSTIIAAAFAVGQNTQGFVCHGYSQPGGAHNYQAVLQVAAGSGSPTVGVIASASSGAARTAYIMVEDVAVSF